MHRPIVTYCLHVFVCVFSCTFGCPVIADNHARCSLGLCISICLFFVPTHIMDVYVTLYHMGIICVHVYGCVCTFMYECTYALYVAHSIMFCLSMLSTLTCVSVRKCYVRKIPIATLREKPGIVSCILFMYLSEGRDWISCSVFNDT